MFVLIVVRTLISSNYSLEQFGVFTFSFTIANAVMLLLDSLAFIIFPKLIDMLSSIDMQQIKKSLGQINDIYISTAHLFIYIAMILFPVLLMFMPQYENSQTSMNLIALTVLVSTNTFGYTSFLLAQNKEMNAALLAFSTMVLSIVLGLVFVKLLKVEFHYVVISTMITYFVYSIACMFVGERIIGEFSLMKALKNTFPVRLFLPFSIALVFSILKLNELLFLSLVIYVILNISTLKSLLDFVKKLVTNPNISNI